MERVGGDDFGVYLLPQDKRLEGANSKKNTGVLRSLGDEYKLTTGKHIEWFSNEEIRNGLITREEGVKLVDKYDGMFNINYVKDFCKYINITFNLIILYNLGGGGSNAYPQNLDN